MKIVLSGAPLSTNSIYRSHCRFGYPAYYMTKEGVKLKNEYRKEMWMQRESGKLLDKPFAITVDFYLKTKRKFDTDNMKKLLFDAGNKVLWEDDSLIVDDH